MNTALLTKNLTGIIWPLCKKLMAIIASALIASCIFKLIFFQFYIVPTPSMEPTIPVGYGVFISKLQYGPRGNGWHLPGYSEIKRNDIIVFESPRQKDDYLIKRCVGLPGEVIRITHTEVFINSLQFHDNTHNYLSYLVKAKSHVAFNNLKQHYSPVIKQSSEPYLVLTLNNEEAFTLKQTKNIETVKAVETTVPDYRVFPLGLNKGWNRDNFGPIVIPKKGFKANLDQITALLYGKAIEDDCEGNSVITKDDGVYINGKRTSSYIFKKNYYFMMGDNRHNSNDSRFWGVVAEDKIIGKAICKVRLGQSPFSANQSLVSKLY